ncbi:hypothetical protein [Alcaligenes faecalis]|uniref:hypothetical protein n=1 Tax=Alcaligenes faecalis TaxID=511 RepID=UPI00117736BD|nr:hypothetical protein [Alcaligenes faecalis]
MSILFGLTLMFSAPALAREAIVTIVREMLLLEAEQARQNMSSDLKQQKGREGAGLPDVSKLRSSIPVPALKLKAIYGRDTQLLAEVQRGQRLLLFQQGQLWPIGRERDRSMRLLFLDSRCIELEVGLSPDSSLSAASDQEQQQAKFQVTKLCLSS